MLKITPQGERGNTIEQFEYIQDTNFVSPIILPVTRWLRAINAEKYIGDCERFLDIGCGDGYFLRRRKECKERYGLDALLGDTVTDTLDFPNDYFDYVTLLAVIEHLSDPEKLVDEICRVLTPNGKLIITTPKKKAEFIIGLYAPDVENMHKSYFDISRIKDIAGDNYDLIGNNTFIFGLNQVFCLQKINSCNIEKKEADTNET